MNKPNLQPSILYSYERSFARSGIDYIVVAIILSAAACLLGGTLNPEGMGVFALTAVKVLAYSVACIFLLRGLTLIIMKGGCKVIITSEGIVWSSSKGMASRLFASDDSCNVTVKDVARVEYDSARKASAEDISSRSIVLVTKDGLEYRLGQESGADLDKIVECMKLLEVQVVIDS